MATRKTLVVANSFHRVTILKQYIKKEFEHLAEKLAEMEVNE